MNVSKIPQLFARSRGQTWLVLALLLSGCGLSTYEERLQRSADFYGYLQLLDENLERSAWASSGMSLRMPKPFKMPLPGPEIDKDATGEEIVGPDPRQSNLLGVEVPGLVEGWVGKLNGEDEPGVSIYILSNQDRLLNKSEGAPPAREFFSDLENVLSTALQVTIQDSGGKDADNARSRLMTPERNSPHSRYILPKDYDVISFVPSGPVNGVNLEARLYERKAGDTQAAMLIFGTRDDLSQFQFRKRVELALETWEIQAQAARSNRPGSAAPTSGAPSSGGGTSGF